MSSLQYNPEPILTRHLAKSRAFSKDPVVVVDVGARNGVEWPWYEYGDGIQVLGFDPDAAECERLNRSEARIKATFYPFALAKTSGTREFHLIESHVASSSFYEPNYVFLRRFPDEIHFASRKLTKVATKDFNSFAKEKGISPDFIKLDVEGAELEALQGADSFLKKTVLGITLEVEFSPIFQNQPLFADLDIYLRKFGFHLFDLGLFHNLRKTLEVVPRHSDHGQVIVGHALYFRDGAREIAGGSLLENGWNDLKILKLATFLESYRLEDCAIELLQAARAKGYLKDYDVGRFIDLLVPRVGRRTFMHHQYLEYLKKRSVPKAPKFERARKLYRRAIPESVRRIIRKILLP